MSVINATSIQQSDTYSLQSANVFLHCMRGSVKILSQIHFIRQ